MRTERDYHNHELEKKVLSHYVRFDTSIPLRLEYLTMEEARELFSFCTTHKKLAKTFKEWWEIWSIDLDRKSLPLDAYQKFLRSLWTEDEETPERIDYYLGELKGFAEGRDLYVTLEGAINLFKVGSPKDARILLENNLLNIRSNFSPQVMSRSDFVEDFSERFTRYKKRKSGEEVAKIPTGIRKLDRKIGGVNPASLNFIQGESGRGKTFVLLEIAYGAFCQKLKVLIITVELRREEIEARLDGRVTGLKYRNLDKGNLTPEQENLWRKRIRDLKKLTKEGARLGEVFIPEGCTVASIEAELDYWEERWGYKVDMIVLDYADLMETPRKVFSGEERLGCIFKDLKRLSQERNIVVWTASQTSGASYGKRVLTLADTGYSKKKAQWSNLVIGMGSDPDDVANGILRLSISKNTYGPSGGQVVLYTDFSRAMIDVDRGGKKKDDKEDN